MLHSWTGLIAANLLFVVCFSGAIALFKHELHAWEKLQQRLAYTDTTGQIDALVYRALSEAMPDPKQSILITLPRSLSENRGSTADKLLAQIIRSWKHAL